MNKNDYIEELKNIFNTNIGEYDVDKGDIKRYLYCPLSCQGYSKNRKGHFEVDYTKGICYCYRCVEGISIYNMLKRFKNSDNRVYINSMMNMYFNYYSHDINSKSNNVNQHNSYEFTYDNGFKNTISELFFSDNQQNFLKNRFPTLSFDEIKSLLYKFKFIPATNDNFFYYSHFNKFIYLYLFKNNSYVKSKKTNINITDKKDYYYYISNYRNKNLYISEGIIDLMTLYHHDPLMNVSSSNFLALCSRNYRFLYEFLLNSGTFYYDNIYYIRDNDVYTDKFVSGILKQISNIRNNKKMKMYNSFYLIEPLSKYLDLNDMYVKTESLNDINITKIN
jgi:hypothetical protein